MYRAFPGIVQTHRKVEGQEKELGEALPIWARVSLEQRRSSVSHTDSNRDSLTPSLPSLKAQSSLSTLFCLGPHRAGAPAQHAQGQPFPSITPLIQST